jgi:hypothetical protein
MREICSIRALDNGGVVVQARDPAIVAQNAQPKSSYRDPYREMGFPSLDKALKWIKDNGEALSKSDAKGEYNDSFAQAVKEG